MEELQNLKVLYEASQPKNTYYLAPRVGFYKVESTYGMLIGKQLELIATTIWKPYGATKSSAGLLVDVQISLLEKLNADRTIEYFDSSTMMGQVIEVTSSEVIVDVDNGRTRFIYQGNYKLRGKPSARPTTIGELMHSDAAEAIIDNFLSSNSNLSLFCDDGPEYFDEPIDDDYDLMGSFAID